MQEIQLECIFFHNIFFIFLSVSFTAIDHLLILTSLVATIFLQQIMNKWIMTTIIMNNTQKTKTKEKWQWNLTLLVARIHVTVVVDVKCIEMLFELKWVTSVKIILKKVVLFGIKMLNKRNKIYSFVSNIFSFYNI